MRKLARTLDRLRGKEIPVLIEGETGSGKEFIARMLHEESPRAGGPFVVVDPSTIPAGLFESELFGSRAGAFTDQRQDREGILARASGGTVLLDEVTHLPLESQAKLLRVISRGRVRPLGAEEDVPLAVRFLFATSADLAAETEAGRFRSDLFYRLRGMCLRVPPLRERGEDLPELIELIQGELTGKDGSTGGVAPAVAPAILKRLRARSWTGNVRELRNLLQRIQVSHPGPIVLEALEAALGEHLTGTVFPRHVLLESPLPSLRRQLDRDYLVCHFRRLEGSTAALCKFLGLSRRQLYRRCVRLGILLREERRKL